MAKVNFSDLENNELLLVVSPSNMVEEVNLEIMRYFINKKDAYCVYVTIAKPYKTILNILKKNRISSNKIFFIDCISGLITGEDMQRAGNCILCQPQSLTNISIALTSALKSIPTDQEKVLILDTISTLMLYNEVLVIGRFMHALTGKIRKLGVKSVIFTLEEETDKKILSQMSHFCDKCITLKD